MVRPNLDNGELFSSACMPKLTTALVAHHVSPAPAAVGLAVRIDEQSIAARAGNEYDAAARQAGPDAAEGVRADGVVARGVRVDPVQRLRQQSVALLLLAAAQVQALMSETTRAYR